MNAAHYNMGVLYDENDQIVGMVDIDEDGYVQQPDWRDGWTLEIWWDISEEQREGLRRQPTIC